EEVMRPNERQSFQPRQEETHPCLVKVPLKQIMGHVRSHRGDGGGGGSVGKMNSDEKIFALSIFCLEADVSSQQKGAFPPREHTPNIPLRYRNAFPNVSATTCGFGKSLPESTAHGSARPLHYLVSTERGSALGGADLCVSSRPSGLPGGGHYLCHSMAACATIFTPHASLFDSIRWRFCVLWIHVPPGHLSEPAALPVTWRNRAARKQIERSQDSTACQSECQHTVPRIRTTVGVVHGARCNHALPHYVRVDACAAWILVRLQGTPSPLLSPRSKLFILIATHPS
ncbi:hypothetical protein KUCAC02_025068, partial [Chaenocephalus aceratus]